jgi:hypothetical protein
VDPTRNPFAPGAGTQPPELAGREAILSSASIALERIRQRRSAKSQLLLGLRGVGKTVLLNRISELAEQADHLTILLEAPEDRSLAELLVPQLRSTLFRLSRIGKVKTLALRGLGVLRAFAGAFKVKVGDVEFSVDAESGTADSGDMETDLPELLQAVAAAASAADKALALFIDEIQYLREVDLGALIVTAHRLAQKNLPFVLFGAGLPQLAGLVGEVKSYAERLFDFANVGPLGAEAARNAIEAPIRKEGARIDPAALSVVLAHAKGYPYFLQEWGSQTWNVAERSPIREADAHAATQRALAALDGGFFRVRLDRLTPRERDYMRAMAELGAGPHRSGEIAEMLGIAVTAAGPLRAALLRKGMVFSPQHGDTAFTVPLFHEFMRRSMPEWQRPKRARRKR